MAAANTNPVINEFTHPEVKSKYQPVEPSNWNRRINIPKVWSGHVRDLTPEAVEALIRQGRKDIVPIPEGPSSGSKTANNAAGKDGKLS